MKNSRKNVHDRQTKITLLLNKYDKLTIDELSQKLNVSTMTIRRDCKTLIKMGKIEQCKGIITFLHRNYQIDHLNKIKELLAKAAADYIPDKAVISLNSSSTALKVLKYLKDKKDIIVQTNNANLINSPFPKNMAIIYSGGQLTKNRIMVGSTAANAYKNFHATYAIVGIEGINATNGVSSSSYYEADVNRSILKNSQKKIVLADYSKVGKTANFNIAAIKDIDLLITDTFADYKEIAKLRNHDVQVVQVPI